MTTEPKIYQKFKPHPLVASLPAHLKEPANFETIKRAIAETMQKCRKAHSVIGEMADCLACTRGMKERRLLLKRLGFKNPAQLRMWYKIHHKIAEKFPLVNWKKENEVRKALEKLK